MNKTELEAIRQRAEQANILEMDAKIKQLEGEVDRLTKALESETCARRNTNGLFDPDITQAVNIHRSNETPGLMTFDEWAKLSAENRHKYNLLVMEIQSLQTENHQLNIELERRRNELTVMLNERLMPLEQDNARLRAAISESIADVKGAQFTDNTWKEAEAEKRGILAGLENALKGGDK